MKNDLYSIELVAISKIKPHPDNPRVIRDNKYKLLIDSLINFPEMASARPLIVNSEGFILGGNMRYKAMQELKWKQVPITRVDWSEAKQKEFVIKDNANFGEWDWEQLANEWDAGELASWGVDVPKITDGELYTTKVESPIYQCTKDKPSISELADYSVYNRLIDEINNSDVSEIEKEYLKFAATRHIVFRYDLAAEYYAHSDKDVQQLMENSALVIIDFQKAIELGFVRLNETLNEIMQDNGA
jgi:hypothetical protein